MKPFNFSFSINKKLRIMNNILSYFKKLVSNNYLFILCLAALTNFSASGQTTFIVTDRVLGNSSGSFDNIIATAITSANSGNDVIVYFNVAPDACGNTLCYIDNDIPHVTPTSGSILLIALAGNINPQGFEYESSCALPKVFYSTGGVTGGKVKVQNLSFKEIIGSAYCGSKSCGSDKVFAKLEKKLTGVNYKSIQNKFYFYFEEDYSGTSVLDYKVLNSSRQVVLSNTATLLTKEYGDNRYNLNVGTIPPGSYILEITNEKNEKFYLRFSK